MKTTFINKIKKGAFEAYYDFGILPSLTMAQAILESGWGKASIGNNIFGIKASADWKGKTQTVQTREFTGTKWITINAKFRDYNSIEECIRDRSLFLSKPRYAKVLAAKDYKTASLEIYRAGYATDPKYPSKLITIIEQNKLYEFDREVKSKPKLEPIKKQEGVNTMANNIPSQWAKESWDWAVKNKLIDGTRPKDKITREEVAVIIERLVKLK